MRKYFASSLPIKQEITAGSQQVGKTSEKIEELKIMLIAKITTSPQNAAKIGWGLAFFAIKE